MKRVFDLVVATPLLLAALPLMAIAAVGIRFSSRGPILFRQVRVGHRGRPFVILKFRTMHDWPTGSIETSSDDPRIFGFGRLLREFHLDELPQLWNVVRGDMSLVGPRPTVPEQVARYTARQRLRLSVRPGITGLAQVSGGNALDWSERIELDLEYVRRRSVAVDIGLLARTIGTVLGRHGVYGADGRVHDLEEGDPTATTTKAVAGDPEPRPR